MKDPRVAFGSAALYEIVAGLFLLAGSGCLFMRDPLDPLGALDHRTVHEFNGVEQEARGRVAYERARRRVQSVTAGMSVAEVEVAMGAVVVVERRGDDDDEMQLPRKKLIGGLLCKVAPSARRQRWIFGYDEGGVELVGFAVEFERDDPEEEGWLVREIDHSPREECP
jgi:hypothetical protein